MKEEKTILIIDDTKINIDILIGLLNNYDIIVALDGMSGLEIAKKENIDLILLDIMMPNMDGYKTCQKLKENSKTKDIPIIFLTAKTDEKSIERAYEVGGVDYITKPFKPIELLSRIKTHLHLQDMLKHLNLMVKVEIEKQRKQEKIIIEQSKLVAMGEMVDAIAHQWKQPLSVIKLKTDGTFGMFEFQNENFTLEPEKIKSYYYFINEQIDHMVNTLDEFRTFLRPNKNKKPFSILHCINSILALIKDELLKYKIQTLIDSNIDIEIEGVKNEFKHILLNIINNSKDAFKINKIPKPTIYLRIKEIEDRVIVEIEDNAGGIPIEIINDIFKPNISTKKEIGGTGVGLYMSEQIAKKHSWSIKANNINDGALFQIILLK